ncbi:MAG: hypothetical protein NTZ80_00595 [Patescibacteria group bacterium]|nr:hypothetical protein [Patescibacteria group bacterium]
MRFQRNLEAIIILIDLVKAFLFENHGRCDGPDHELFKEFALAKIPQKESELRDNLTAMIGSMQLVKNGIIVSTSAKINIFISGQWAAAALKQPPIKNNFMKRFNTVVSIQPAYARIHAEKCIL